MFFTHFFCELANVALTRFWCNFLPQKLWLHNIFDKYKVCVFSSLSIRSHAVLGRSVTFIHVDVCTTAHLIIIIISLPVAAIKQDSIMYCAKYQLLTILSCMRTCVWRNPLNKQKKNAITVGNKGDLEPGLIKNGYMKLLQTKKIHY